MFEKKPCKKCGQPTRTRARGKEGFYPLCLKCKGLGIRDSNPFEEGKSTVVVLVEGDLALKQVIEKADGYGYEPMNITSSPSVWTVFTKYTVIFKKR